MLTYHFTSWCFHYCDGKPYVLHFSISDASNDAISVSTRSLSFLVDAIPSKVCSSRLENHTLCKWGRDIWKVLSISPGTSPFWRLDVLETSSQSKYSSSPSESVESHYWMMDFAHAEHQYFPRITFYIMQSPDLQFFHIVPSKRIAIALQNVLHIRAKESHQKQYVLRFSNHSCKYRLIRVL